MPNRGQRYVSLVERGVIRMPASPGSQAGPDPAAPGARQRPSGRPPPPARRPERGPEQRPERGAGRHVWVLAVDGVRGWRCCRVGVDAAVASLPGWLTGRWTIRQRSPAGGLVAWWRGRWWEGDAQG
jgi:hypothetical protein